MELLGPPLLRKKLQQEQFKPAEQLTLEPYERDHAIVCGSYRVGKKKSKD